MNFPCSLLFKEIKVTFTIEIIWMIWRIRTHNRFQDPNVIPFVFFKLWS